MDQILDNLRCPITYDIIEDPVQVPCCGKSVSRNGLKQALNFRRECPLCRHDLSDFDVDNAPTNRDLASVIESLNQNQNNNNNSNTDQNVVLHEHQWSSDIEWIDNKNPTIGRLSVNIKRSHFKTKRTLFVAIVDNSYSMNGLPWNQVKTALVHILGLSANKFQSVETRIIVYNSTASLLSEMKDPSQLNTAINSVKRINADGGTNFLSAYQELSNLLNNIKNNRLEEFSTVSVAFLTDGQDNYDKGTLTEALKHIFVPFQDCFKIIVHSIGFSNDCDKDLLEKMRTAGTDEGTFRYAEPTDDSDALCGKLTDLFTLSEKAATAPIKITLPDGFEFVDSKGDNKKEKDCFIHVEPFSRSGTLLEWIKATNDAPPARISLHVNSSEDNDIEFSSLVKVINGRSEEKDPILQAWLRKVLDGMAAELLEMNQNRNKMAPEIMRLQIALYLSRLNSIGTRIDDPRIPGLKSQIKLIQKGGAINEGKLNDMKFSSMFSPEKRANIPHYQNNHYTSPHERNLPKAIIYSELPVRYSHNNSNKDRNSLQETIINEYPKRCSTVLFNKIDTASIEDLESIDADGNNALHLAAYCGSDKAIERILQKYSEITSNNHYMLSKYVNLTNKEKETAVTLAIKRKGYHNSVQVLMLYGACIDETRIEPLKRFCIHRGLFRTAELLSRVNDTGEIEIDTSMTAGVIKFLWDSATKLGKPKYAAQWLEPALSKCLIDFIKELLSSEESMNDFQIPWKWFINYCLPPKPDHPEVEKYLTMCKMILDYQPSLLHEKDPETGDTTLISSVNSGNLPIVQLFLDLGCSIDETNELGNTALWIACAKRYPCIVTELISRGADVNHVNKKGNRPLCAVCQMGPAKIGQTLIAAGADIEFHNSNGDTPLLLACRNGQTDVASFLLNYIDLDFVLFRAKIDGFDALFASVEADRPDCVRVIAEFGVDIEEKTDKENEIVSEATPLHLAAYYGRTASASVLLELGANPNSKDANGMTPLHTAVLRKQMQMIELLISKNANPYSTDNFGNTPAAFSRDPHVLNLLVNPITEPLHQICSNKITSKTGYTLQDVDDVLTNKSYIPGISTPHETLSVALNQRGMDALMTSVIYSNIDIVSILVKIGFDPNRTDNRGLSSHFWAQWIKNPRLMKAVGTVQEDRVEIQRLRKALQFSPESMNLLLLSEPFPIVERKSSLFSRLELISLMKTDNNEEKVNSLKQLVYENKTNDLTVLYEQNNKKSSNKNQNQNDTNQENIELQNKIHSLTKESLWQAKIEAVSEIASGCNQDLTPSQLISIYLYTFDPNVFEIFTYFLTGKVVDPKIQSIISPFAKNFWTAIDSLPPFNAEVYSCSMNINRRLFAVGNVVSSPTFISATSLWPMAIESINFEKGGTVFIIKSEKKGKLISIHSSFSFESEVLFTPNTKFVVAKWYRGDVIALGQPNIRDHTFGLTDDQRVVISNNCKPLIIELHEVD
ncbi:hypothetical protein TRFO_20016 [Tritrichomonas foetus]|uniref:VWFA domain-containing protein n=1 Tax=Tritrichomonas foetus TaxID=1144522 RepID=A0A1J4KHD8_9EUKA|nr:hypothetical protein TRFO_20016 [Tritrichomonas foetus]|eukprot:OHT10611.1 hypothetical protein TRFO_20016 [Tritrichomonas foetus]